MKIQSITLNNFRCFENLKIDLNDDLTVIVGNNGAGKSSILDAISIAISTFLAGFDNVPTIGISREDARHKFYDMGNVIDVQSQFPVIISAEGSVGLTSVVWKRELSSYTDCLAAQSNERLMLKWFEKMTIQEAQNKTVSTEFLSVKQAIVKCFQGITGYSNVDVLFNLDTHNIDVSYEDHVGAHFSFPMMTLSDGYKSTLWQQRIIKDLTSIFPLVQFIVPTHSPTIISSVCKENLLILEDCNSATYSEIEVYGSDSNSVLESVMGANERPMEIKELFSRFYDLLEDESWDRAEEILNSIEEKIGSSDPELNSARGGIINRL